MTATLFGHLTEQGYKFSKSRTLSVGGERFPVVLFEFFVERRSLLMHQSIAAAPCTPHPRADPRALAIFFLPWMANSRAWGLLSAVRLYVMNSFINMKGCFSNDINKNLIQ